MSAELLREAATVLREHAEAATPGPWNYISRNWIAPGAPIEITEADWGPDGHDRMRVCTNEGEGAWRVEDVKFIALMHPPVALALADWLDAAAKADDARVSAEQEVGLDDGTLLTFVDHAAFALARAILRRSK